MIFPYRVNRILSVRHGASVIKVLHFIFLGIFTLSPLVADVTKSTEEKKKGKEPVSVPEVRDVSARFIEGQSVDIVLDAAIGSVKLPDFIIRQQPEHGTLTNLRPHQKESNKAIITYTHTDKDASLTDRFTYACRVDGGPMSAPAVVILIGQRMEPKLVLVNAPNFAKVFVGGESSSTILLKNEGTAPYLMNIVWPEGWVGPPSIEVPIGKTIDIQVFFRPKKVGVFRFEGELQNGMPLSKVFLYGECLRPLTVSPGNITLSLDAKTGARTGSFSLVNARLESVLVNLKIPERLSCPAEVEVPAKGKVDVNITIPAQDVKAYAGDIQVLVGSAIVEEIGVQASPKPAELRIVTPENGALDFGEIDPRKAVTRELVLLNAGGEPMVIQVDSQQPFSVEASGKAMRIEPLQQRSLKVSLKSDASGKLRQQLKINGGSSALIVNLSAEVKEMSAPVGMQPSVVRPSVSAPVEFTPVPAPSDGTTALARTPMQAAIVNYLQTEGMPIPKELINTYMERVSQVTFEGHTTSTITLSWKKPDIIPAGWVMELSTQVYDPGQSLIIKTWRRFNNWQIIEGGPADKVTVKIHSLKPSSQYEIRIMGVDREGKVSEPSPQMLFSTVESWRIPSWVWRVLIMLSLGLVVYILYRVRRGDFEVD